MRRRFVCATLGPVTREEVAARCDGVSAGGLVMALFEAAVAEVLYPRGKEGGEASMERLAKPGGAADGTRQSPIPLYLPP